MQLKPYASTLRHLSRTQRIPTAVLHQGVHVFDKFMETEASASVRSEWALYLRVCINMASKLLHNRPAIVERQKEKAKKAEALVLEGLKWRVSLGVTVWDHIERLLNHAQVQPKNEHVVRSLKSNAFHSLEYHNYEWDDADIARVILMNALFGGPCPDFSQL